MKRYTLPGLLFLFALAQLLSGAPALPSLRDVLKDEHAFGADHWIYNDLEAAKAEARRTNKPIFVTFRCVPCKACAGFDAEVAKGSQAITDLAKDKFIALRQVEMKGVDLTQFQFDYDLNWAAMFINADGTVYARYGTQSIKGPDSYNSIASLEKTMRRVLALHAAYPENAKSLTEKRGAKQPYQTALDMPELEGKDKRPGATARNNCIHCHNIHDAQQEEVRKAGKLTLDYLYRYPLPENLGLHIDRDDGLRIESVDANSAAAAAGLIAGDSLTHADAQPLTSIADLQWVLHHKPNSEQRVALQFARKGQAQSVTLSLAEGWKKTDFLWRGSRWSLKPRPGFWAPGLKPEELGNLQLEPGQTPLRIQWINNNQSEGRKAKEAGLREGDIILSINGKPLTLTPEKFQMYIRLNFKVGDTITLTVQRGGRKLEIALPLVD